MADVITRFKLETNQYDSKLRDASKQLSELTSHLSLAGRDFERFSQKSVESARALGSIEGGASNAKEKVRELVRAFNEVAKAYNFLTKEQQQTDFGKAMASSLQQLQGRIQTAKQELYNFGNQSKEAGGIMSQLRDKLTLNIDALKLLNIGLKGAKAALNIAMDAFFASESNVDDWGRTVEASKSLYEGFLVSLNTGDISGYLSRINEIVSAARTAYDEMDRLGTLKTIQTPAVSALQTETDRIRLMLQTGRYIEPMDGRRPAPGMTDGQVLNEGQLKNLERHLQTSMKRLARLLGNEVEQTTATIDSEIERLAGIYGIDENEFRKGISSMSEFESRLVLSNEYEKFEKAHSKVKYNSRLEEYELVRDDAVNPHAKYKAWSTFRVDGEGYNNLVRLIQQRDQKMAQVYNMRGQVYRTINRAEGITTRELMGGGSSGKGSGSAGGSPVKGYDTGVKGLEPMANEALVITESMTELNAQLQVYKKKLAQATNIWEYNEAQAGIDRTTEQIAAQPFAMRYGMSTGEYVDYSNSILQSMKDVIGELKPLDIKQSGRNKDATDKEDKSLADVTSQLGSGLGSISSGLDNLGIDLGDGFKDIVNGIQGVTSVLMGIAAVVQAIEAISAISAIVPFASGGVVNAAFGTTIPGTSYSGDNIRAIDPRGQLYGLNSGEVVLNRAETGIVADALSGGYLSNLKLEAVMSAEQIRFVLRNNSLRWGKGEYLTSKTL